MPAESRGRVVGIIAGNGRLPAAYARRAKDAGCTVLAACHRGETDPEVEQLVDRVQWVRVGELGKIFSFFRRYRVDCATMIGGVNRVRLFGGVRLDLRAIALLARLRSTKDDIIMRGIAAELEKEGISVTSSTEYLTEFLVPEGVLTREKPTDAEKTDVAVGAAALRAMSGEDIGQLVVVRNGVITAVEAVEGSDRAIVRGGELGGPGSVVVKFAKATQDMRFDVPTIGMRTITSMCQVQARVLAVEAERCLMLEPDNVIRAANEAGMVIVGCRPEAR